MGNLIVIWLILHVVAKSVGLVVCSSCSSDK